MAPRLSLKERDDRALDETAIILRAVELARRAEGRTAPNPMVGCVLMRDGEVIGEGWHKGPGQLHAEAAALVDAIERGGDARGATAYVTLEPCNHHGRTPPCSEGLIAAGVAEVVYAVPDPNPLAAGGAERLRAAGLKVRHVPMAEADRLARPWIYSLRAPRPWVTAKLAMSLDGRTATRSGASKWITGELARGRGHDLRQVSDAILIGVGTVLADDPGLDPRPEGREPAPSLKVILDTSLRTPPTAKLLTTPGSVLIASGPEAAPARVQALEAAGAEILPLPLEAGRLPLDMLLRHLKDRACQRVMIEGGGTLLGAAFDGGLVDEVWAFLAPTLIGGGRPAIDGMGPEGLEGAFDLDDLQTEQLGRDLLLRGVLAKRGEAVCSRAS